MCQGLRQFYMLTHDGNYGFILIDLTELFQLTIQTGLGVTRCRYRIWRHSVWGRRDPAFGRQGQLKGGEYFARFLLLYFKNYLRNPRLQAKMQTHNCLTGHPSSTDIFKVLLNTLVTNQKDVWCAILSGFTCSTRWTARGFILVDFTISQKLTYHVKSNITQTIWRIVHVTIQPIGLTVSRYSQHPVKL